MNAIRKSHIPRLALSLFLSTALIFPGCGSSRTGTAVPTQGDADVPALTAQQLRACAEEHKMHFGQARHAIHFEVHLSDDGQVDSVSLEHSTLEDQGLEACMASALRSLSMNELPLRTSEHASPESASPDSRKLLGQEQVLLCFASPPCVLALTMLIGATFLTVYIYVHAAQSSTIKLEPPPTAEIDCKKVKEECITKCSDTDLPTPDFGARFFKCVRACLEANGC